MFLATILPDLAGHHFKQPYGKEYGTHWNASFYLKHACFHLYL